MKKILLISGSLREKSVNTSLLRSFEHELKDKADVVWGDIQLPLFNEDIEANFPKEVDVLKQQILESDIIIISTPEYNRATTGALKNALDWASRPYGKSAWPGKTVFVTSASSGGISGVVALYQVKQSLMHLGAHVLSSPEFMVGNAFQKFDENGVLTDEKTRDFVSAAVKTLID